MDNVTASVDTNKDRLQGERRQLAGILSPECVLPLSEPAQLLRLDLRDKQAKKKCNRRIVARILNETCRWFAGFHFVCHTDRHYSSFAVVLGPTIDPWALL